jgi:hypothetical protein
MLRPKPAPGRLKCGSPHGPSTRRWPTPRWAECPAGFRRPVSSRLPLPVRWRIRSASPCRRTTRPHKLPQRQCPSLRQRSRPQTSRRHWNGYRSRRRHPESAPLNRPARRSRHTTSRADRSRPPRIQMVLHSSACRFSIWRWPPNRGAAPFPKFWECRFRPPVGDVGWLPKPPNGS